MAFGVEVKFSHFYDFGPYEIIEKKSYAWKDYRFCELSVYTIFLLQNKMIEKQLYLTKEKKSNY